MTNPVSFKACYVKSIREQDVHYAAIHAYIGDDQEGRTFCFIDRRFSTSEAATKHAAALLASMTGGMLHGTVELPGIVHNVAMFGTPPAAPKREGLN